VSEADDAQAEEPDPVDAVFDEVRVAAGAVVASLKQLIEATERVVADPAAFASAVDGGRSVVEAFVGGFVEAGDSGEDSGASSPSAPAGEGDESAS
jgi:hypothetical protein